MTKTYDDIEAVTQLLEEKERDIELAAKIGKNLLEKNKELDRRAEELEEQLNRATDRVKQLSHDLALKDDLLQIYTQNEDVSASSSPTESKESLGASGASGISLSSVNVDHLHRKLRHLEEENMQLRQEHTSLHVNAHTFEETEQSLVKECMRQLSEANNHIRSLSDDLNKKSDQCMRQQDEVTGFLTRSIDLENKVKHLTNENDGLQERLKEAHNTQRDLTRELLELHDKYDECLALLNEAHDDIRAMRKKQHRTSIPPAYLTPQGMIHPMGYSIVPGSMGMMGPCGSNSLALELEATLRRHGTEDRMSQNMRVMEQARSVNQAWCSPMVSTGGQPRSSTGLDAVPGLMMNNSIYSVDDYSIDGDISMATTPGGGYGELGGGAPPPWSQLYQVPVPGPHAMATGHIPLGSGGLGSYGSLGVAHGQIPLASGGLESYGPPSQTADTGYGGDSGEDDGTRLHQKGGVRSTFGDTDPSVLTSGGDRIPGSLDIDLAMRKFKVDSDRVRANTMRRRRNRSISYRSDDESITPSVGSPGDSSPPYLTTDSHYLHPEGPCDLSTDSLPASGASYAPYYHRLPEKLQIVKPLEGSQTLRHWQQLATPSLTRALFEDQPGVRVRGGHMNTGTELELGQDSGWALSDLEEDDPFCSMKAKKAFQTSATFTYTTAKILHPTDDYPDSTQLTSVLSSHLLATTPCRAAAGDSTPTTPTQASTAPKLPGSLKRNATSTFSLNLSLASLLQERGIRPKTYEQFLHEAQGGSPIFPDLTNFGNPVRFPSIMRTGLNKTEDSEAVDNYSGAPSPPLKFTIDIEEDVESHIGDLKLGMFNLDLGSLVSAVLPSQFHPVSTPVSSRAVTCANSAPLTSISAVGKLRPPTNLGLNVLARGNRKSDADILDKSNDDTPMPSVVHRVSNLGSRSNSTDDAT